MRLLAREYLVLSASRQAAQQRIHAHLFHQGVPSIPDLLTHKGQAGLAAAELSPAARQVIDLESAKLDTLAQLIASLKAQIEGLGRQLPGPRALDKLWGIGPLTAVVIWSEIGDCRRFRQSAQVVRLAGLDVSVWSSDSKRSPGKLARQGAPALRWALYEAAMTASRSGSPDNAYYRSLAQRLKGKRAALSVARKLARRCYHTLREMGAEAMAETTVSASATAA